MESKHNYLLVNGIRRFLLIEPVWNRNLCKREQLRSAVLLLIEPVWNRNFRKLCHLLTHRVLLIEPVWNRNQRKRWGFCFVATAFNRTSMESKHAFLFTFDASASALLIEPVWNRNVFCFDNIHMERALLIEPVWNRNFLTFRKGRLLKDF